MKFKQRSESWFFVFLSVSEESRQQILRLRSERQKKAAFGRVLLKRSGSGLLEESGVLHNFSMLFKQSEKLICAFCKLQHRVYVKKEVSFFDAVIMLSITGVLAFAIWGGPDLRSLIIFMSLAFVFQVFLRMRYRESVKCPHCGFDPILYKQDNKMAASKVKTFLEERKEDPAFLLKPQPKIEPIYLSKEQMKLIEQEKLEESQTQISEQLPPSKENSPVSGQLL